MEIINPDELRPQERWLSNPVTTTVVGASLGALLTYLVTRAARRPEIARQKRVDKAAALRTKFQQRLDDAHAKVHALRLTARDVAVVRSVLAHDGEPARDIGSLQLDTSQLADDALGKELRKVTADLGASQYASADSAKLILAKLRDNDYERLEREIDDEITAAQAAVAALETDGRQATDAEVDQLLA